MGLHRQTLALCSGVRRNRGPAGVPGTAPASVNYAARWGLVSYWNLEDLTDAYGANTLTNNNGVTFTAGKVGNAATFAAASSQELTRASNSGLQTGNVDWWLSIWANPTTLPAFPFIAGKFLSSGFGSEWALSIDGSNRPNLAIYENSGGTNKSATWGSALSTATWYHLFGWYDSVGHTVNLSVNAGTAVSTSTAAFTPSSNTSALWLGSSGGSSFWNGRLDAVGFGKSPPLGVAAVATEIRDFLYNGGSGVAYPF